MAWACYDPRMIDIDLMSRRGMLRISFESMRQILGLPDDVYITSTATSYEYDEFHIGLRSRRFPISVEGAAAPTYTIEELEDNDDM